MHVVGTGIFVSLGTAAGVAGLPEVTIDSDPYEWCAFAVAPGVARCGECAFGND